MAMEKLEGIDALALGDGPEEEPAEEQGRASGFRPLHSLRAAWEAYKADSKRRWDKLAEEQAQNPTLD
jgi:hypothetical protein